MVNGKADLMREALFAIRIDSEKKRNLLNMKYLSEMGYGRPSTRCVATSIYSPRMGTLELQAS
jgi:hypothetical protein